MIRKIHHIIGLFLSPFEEPFLVYKTGKKGGGGKGTEAPAPAAPADPAPAAPDEGLPELPETLGKAPEDRKGTIAETMAKLESLQKEQLRQATDRMVESLKEWKVAVLRGNNDINPDLWDPASTEGMAKIEEDWKKLGIYVDNDFYNKEIFGELRKCSGDFPKTIESEQKRAIYLDPLKHLDELGTLNNAPFQMAVKFLVTMTDLVKKQDLFEKAYEDEANGLNDDPILGRGAQVVRDNVTEFTTALREGDTMKAGMYVAGIVALYYLYKSLPEGEEGEGEGKEGEGGDLFSRRNIKKLLIVGTALYAGDMYLKASGIDILEKLGIKDELSSLQGTSLEFLPAIHMQDETLRKGGLSSKIDRVILKKMALANITDLSRAYYETHNQGVKYFIDPNLFPAQFPDLGGFTPYDLAHPGKLTLSQKSKLKKYKEVGEKLYILYQAIQSAYTVTMKDESGLTFEQALEDGILSKSNILMFTMALERHVRRLTGKGLLSIETLNKTKKVLMDALQGSGLGLSSDIVPNKEKPGTFVASLMGYPVIIENDYTNNRYVFFPRNEYDKGSIHITKAMLIVSYDGKADRAFTDVITDIGEKMKGLVKAFGSSADMTFDHENLKYDDKGYWITTLKVSGVPLLEGQDGDMTVKVIPTIDGKGVRILDREGKVIVSIKDVTDRSKLVGSVILGIICNQEKTVDDPVDYRLLGYFKEAGKLEFFDNDSSDYRFGVKIGNFKFEGSDFIGFVYNKDEKRYEFEDKKYEQALLKDRTFRQELAYMAMENDEITATESNLVNLFKSVDEDHLGHILSSVFGDWWKEGIDITDLGGSVQEGYARALIKAQKGLVAAKLMYAMDSTSTFGDAMKKIEGVFPMAMKGFMALDRKLMDALITGEKVDDAKFKELVKDIREIGTSSVQYRQWYAEYTERIYKRYGRWLSYDKMEKLCEVFTYYTAQVDDPERIDNVDLTMIFSADESKLVDLLGIAERKGETLDNAKVTQILTDNTLVEFPKGDPKKALDTYKKLRKTREYYVAQAWVSHVEYKIFSRILPKGGDTIISDPGTADWDIGELDEKFRERPTAPNPNLIDTSKPMETMREWASGKIELDQAFIDAFDPAKTVVDLTKIKLPRKPLKLKIPTAKRDALTEKLWKPLNLKLEEFSDGVMSDTEAVNYFTPIELALQKKVKEIIGSMEDKYGDNFREWKADEFVKSQFTRVFQKPGKPEVDEASGDRTIELIPTKMAGYAELVEQNILRRGGNITGNMQETEITQMAAEVVRIEILTGPNFKKYFDTKSTVWQDVKDWFLLTWLRLTA